MQFSRSSSSDAAREQQNAFKQDCAGILGSRTSRGADEKEGRRKRGREKEGKRKQRGQTKKSGRKKKIKYSLASLVGELHRLEEAKDAGSEH